MNIYLHMVLKVSASALVVCLKFAPCGKIIRSLNAAGGAVDKVFSFAVLA
jgi:hypothetical protein